MVSTYIVYAILRAEGPKLWCPEGTTKGLRVSKEREDVLTRVLTVLKHS